MSLSMAEKGAAPTVGADAEPLLPTLRNIRFEAGNRDRVDEMIAAIEKAVTEKKAEKKS